jgi:hypothetical protein
MQSNARLESMCCQKPCKCWENQTMKELQSHGLIKASTKIKIKYHTSEQRTILAFTQQTEKKKMKFLSE